MRNRAVFTIVQNEPVFLPLWLRYYGRYFEPCDIYVLDHDSIDRSTEGVDARYNLLGVHRDESFDHEWLKNTVAAFQTFLLHSYENVLFAEVDEFILADPDAYSGLDDYIARFRDRVARCTGFDVVHYANEEPALRFDEPILAQRKYWYASRLFCKPLLAKVPLSWGVGFHDEGRSLERRQRRRRRRRRLRLLRRAVGGLVRGRAPGVDRKLRDLQPAPDPDLLLVHLHRVDYGYCLARHRSNASRNWNERDLQAGLGRQNRIVDSDEFDEWFYRDSKDGERQLIPEHLKQLL